MRVLSRLMPLRWRSPARRLEAYPPYRFMAVRVLELSPDWRQVRILLPLNARTRNPGGGMFGGAMAALADPIPALSCNRVFPGHRVWTRALQLDFRREGRGDLELRYRLEPAVEQQIGAELAQQGRATPTLELGFFDTAGRLCARVSNTVAIRPADYRPAAPRQSEPAARRRIARGKT
jgi:acyl-coenzyme A thioesterase PaaI-like protein